MNQSLPIRRAFTLLEVLVAIGIIAALLGTMFSYLLDVQATRTRLLERGRTGHAAAVLIDRLESRLMAAIVGDAKHGSGLHGDESAIRILWRGVNLTGNAASITSASILSDLQRTEISFDPTSRAVQVSESSLGGAGVPVGPESLDAIVFKLRFRYHDGRQWRDSFDSIAQNRLPVAVEIAMWLRPAPGFLPEDAIESDLSENTAAAVDFDAQFDARFDATFDEQEHLRSADPSHLNEPEPDRLRIIFIPDSGEAEAVDELNAAEDVA